MSQITLYRHDTTNDVYLTAVEYPSKFRTTGFSYSKLYKVIDNSLYAFTEPYKSGTLQTQFDLIHTYYNDRDGTQGFSDPSRYECTQVQKLINMDANVDVNVG